MVSGFNHFDDNITILDEYNFTTHISKELFNEFMANRKPLLYRFNLEPDVQDDDPVRIFYSGTALLFHCQSALGAEFEEYYNGIMLFGPFISSAILYVEDDDTVVMDVLSED